MIKNDQNEKKNIHSQCIQFFIDFIYIGQQSQQFIESGPLFRRIRRTHCPERFQSLSFFMKKSQRIHTTRNDRHSHRHRKDRENEFNIIQKNNYMKNEKFEHHHRFNFHDFKFSK